MVIKSNTQNTKNASDVVNWRNQDKKLCIWVWLQLQESSHTEEKLEINTPQNVYSFLSFLYLL